MCKILVNISQLPIKGVMSDPNYTTADWRLLIAAEARIDTAMAKLMSTTQEVTEATGAQAEAVRELKEARDAIRTLREGEL